MEHPSTKFILLPSLPLRECPTHKKRWYKPVIQHWQINRSHPSRRRKLSGPQVTSDAAEEDTAEESTEEETEESTVEDVNVQVHMGGTC